MSDSTEPIQVVGEQGPADPPLPQLAPGNTGLVIEYNPKKQRVEKIHFNPAELTNWEFILAVLGMGTLYATETRDIIKARNRQEHAQSQAMIQQLRRGP